jgi:hypothetical protein
MRDQKEETVRLQEERKADSARHKEEVAQLYRSLLLEEDSRKNENESLRVKTRQLTATITKEREERRAVDADLEAKLEECHRELRNAKEQHHNDMRDISEVPSYVPFSPTCPHICPF